MAFITVFQRYETKYLITEKQKNRIIDYIHNYTLPDKYGRSTIRNIYFDTDNYRLIRRSIEHPLYKEKLRLRSYSGFNEDKPVFLEIKKKCMGVVNKRRILIPRFDAMNWICNKIPPPVLSQIANEIDYFLSFYGQLSPKMFISYDRDAFYGIENPDFRITFDGNITASEDCSFNGDRSNGVLILPRNMSIMEIKCNGGIPLWMAEILSKEKIYKSSFSKYGTAYKQLIFNRPKEVI